MKMLRSKEDWASSTSRCCPVDSGVLEIMFVMPSKFHHKFIEAGLNKIGTDLVVEKCAFIE